MQVEVHRVLVISVGRGLEKLHHTLEQEYAERRHAGMLPPGDVEAEFLLAPVEGVGNLSRPVEVLRKRLFEDISESLTKLLTLQPGRKGEFIVDIVLVTNHGEELASNADIVVFDAVRSIIDEKFSPLFPRHRRGADRRWRLLPVVMLPADGQTPRPRNAVLFAAREQHDRLATLRTEENTVDCPVDRLFVLDALTQHGIATWSALLDQAANFVRFLLFSGMRTQTNVLQWLETPGPDLPASFGIVMCKIRPKHVQRSLQERLALEAASAINTVTRAELPGLNELLSPVALEDEDAFERTMTDLRETPARVLEVDGPGAITFLEDLFADALDRIDLWSEQALADQKREHESNNPTDEGVHAGWVSALSATTAGGTFAAGYYLAGLTIAASASAALGVGAVALASIWMIWASVARSKTDGGQKRVTSDVKDVHEMAESRLEMLRHTADSSLKRVVLLRERLQHLESSIGVEVDSRWFPERLVVDTEPEPEHDAIYLTGDSPFCRPLDNPEFVDALYEEFNPHTDAQRAGHSYLESIGTWTDLLAADVLPDAESLCEFCEATFKSMFRERVFSHVDARRALQTTVGAFLDTWALGPPEFLEYESLKQRDPNGFRRAFDRSVFVAQDLEPMVNESMKGSELALECADPTLHDVFIVDATTDIAIDAVAVLTTKQRD